MDEANEENTVKHFQGKDVFFSVFGTTKSAAGGNVGFKNVDKNLYTLIKSVNTFLQRMAGICLQIF